MKKSLLVDIPNIEASIKSTRIWQKQANQVNEESLKSELDEAFIDWGIAQGYINCLKQLQVISKEDYKYLSKKQLIISERLKLLKEKRQGVTN